MHDTGTLRSLNAKSDDGSFQRAMAEARAARVAKAEKRDPLPMLLIALAGVALGAAVFFALPL